VLTAVVVVVAVVAGSGGSALLATDLEVGIGFRAPGATSYTPVQSGTRTQVATTNFSLVVTIENRGADPSTAAVRVQLPAGLTWGAQVGTDPSVCSAPPDVVCPAPADLDAGIRTGWEWHVTADAPGDYVVSASLVSPPASDANPSNNQSSVTLGVQGRTGSGGGSNVVTASKARFTPAKPVAGRRVSVTVLLTPTIKPSSVSCSANAGSLRLKGRGFRAAGKAECRFVPPSAARGKTLRGKLVTAAGGKTFSRGFSARLR
jgi:hypothetical protein